MDPLRLAEAAARSRHIRLDSVDDALLAIQIADDLGIPRTMALMRPSIVRGIVPAEVMVACVLRAGHELWPDEGNDDKVATAHGRRSGSDRVVSASFTLADAVKAGLVKVDGNGEVVAGQTPWTAYRADMLWARAVSRLVRRAFPDVLAGASYVPGELPDDDEIVPEPVSEQDAEQMRARLVEQGWADLRGEIAGLDDDTRVEAEAVIEGIEDPAEARARVERVVGLDELRAALDAMGEDERAAARETWKAAGLPPLSRLPLDRVPEARALLGLDTF